MTTAIDRHARATPGYDDRVAAAVDVLRRAAADHPGAVVQAASLGVEDMVVTDLIARHRLPIAIATLDTGRLHRETLELIPALEARYGVAVERWSPPGAAVVRFVARQGTMSMRDSVEQRRACCALRKLEPLARMLHGRSAWITGLRRGQSTDRAAVEPVARDDAGRIKYSPLAAWSQADVWHHVATNDVPYNPLHDAFFASIGCEPCTRAIALGEEERAGRWWWENDAAKECGLHRPHSAAAPAADSRSEAGGIVSAQAHIGAADVKGAPAPGRSQRGAAKECGLHSAHSFPGATPGAALSAASSATPAQAHIGAADVKGAPAPGRSQNNDAAKECGLHSPRSAAAPAADLRRYESTR